MATSRMADRYGLTERERQTLDLILAGHTFQRIADLQGISLGGVQGRAKAIYHKLGIHSKQEAIDMAASFGSCEQTETTASSKA